MEMKNEEELISKKLIKKNYEESLVIYINILAEMTTNQTIRKYLRGKRYSY